VQPRTIAATRTKPLLNERLLFCALVLNAIVQQPGNRLILITAQFQHEAGRPQQMSDIRCLRAFPQRLRVNGHGKRRRVDQPRPTAGFLIPSSNFVSPMSDQFSMIGSNASGKRNLRPNRPNHISRIKVVRSVFTLTEYEQPIDFIGVPDVMKPGTGSH